MGARVSMQRYRSRRRALTGVSLAVALGGAFVACGGEDQGRPPAPVAAAPLAEGDTCADAAGFEFFPIIDFEGPPEVGMPPKDGLEAPRGTRLSCNPGLGASGEGGAGGAGAESDGGSGPLAPVPVCGFNLNFEQPTVCTVDAVTVPNAEQTTNHAANKPPWVGLEVPGGRCGAPTHAYHLVARNLGVCFNAANGRRGWGSNFSIDLKGPSNPDGTEFDASAWEGISFWARLGDGPSNRAITVIVGDAETSGAPYAEPNESGQTECLTTDIKYDSLKCDPFGVVVTLTREWAFYAIPFGQLKQKGYGQKAPRGAIDPTRIRRFQISTSTGDWDFYVDDLAFFRDKP